MINFEFSICDEHKQPGCSESFGLDFFNPMFYFMHNPLLAHQTVNIIRAGHSIYLVNTKNKVIKFQENELTLGEQPATLDKSRIINANITELENDEYRPVKKISDTDTS